MYRWRHHGTPFARPFRKLILLPRSSRAWWLSAINETYCIVIGIITFPNAARTNLHLDEIFQRLFLFHSIFFKPLQNPGSLIWNFIDVLRCDFRITFRAFCRKIFTRKTYFCVLVPLFESFSKLPNWALKIVAKKAIFHDSANNYFVDISSTTLDSDRFYDEVRRRNEVKVKGRCTNFQGWFFSPIQK